MGHEHTILSCLATLHHAHIDENLLPTVKVLSFMVGADTNTTNAAVQILLRARKIAMVNEDQYRITSTGMKGAAIARVRSCEDFLEFIGTFLRADDMEEFADALDEDEDADIEDAWNLFTSYIRFLGDGSD